MLSFVGYLFMWVGAWDYIDVHLIPEDVTRDSLYVCAPVVICFIFEEILSQESLYYMAAWTGKHCRSKYGPKNRFCKVCCVPGQTLGACRDSFVRNFIQPKVVVYISPCQDLFIRLFNYVNAILIVTVIQLFLWVGMWDLFSYYVWPYDDTSYRDLTYCVLGSVTMYLSLVFFSTDQSYEDMEDSWHEGIPLSFGFRRKLKNYAREMLNFIGFLFVWVGAWDFIDTKIWEASIQRDILYYIIPWFFSFTLEELLSPESLYYILTTYTKRHHDAIIG